MVSGRVLAEFVLFLNLQFGVETAALNRGCCLDGCQRGLVRSVLAITRNHLCEEILPMVKFNALILALPNTTVMSGLITLLSIAKTGQGPLQAECIWNQSSRE